MKTEFFGAVDPKQSFPQIERDILAFWESEKIFEQSVENRRGKKKFVFFDGPPFANGMPHYGHILASALKDAVTRYWTMKGLYVPRVNGWDCHGLPVEYEIEKELKLSGRKDIEKMGVEKFNDACRESVFRYTRDWQVLLKRIARWVDFEHEYATLENNYMESIWWVFSEIWKKGLVYEGYKPMHICPRCETSLSNFEVTQGYKDVADTSIVMKFELEDAPNTFFLAWTTTPWSSLSVTGLAIGADFDYALVRMPDGAQYYCAQNRVEAIFSGMEGYEIVKVVKGKELAHKKYKHLFEMYNDRPEVLASKNAFRTVITDYVSVDDGTGIVTINGAFGDIDFEAATKHGLPIFVNVKMDGCFTEETGPQFAGKFVKDAESEVIADLKKRGLLFRKDGIRHSYPHCWRCDSPLLNYATNSWFIRVTDLKETLIKNNKKIHWVPDHIQEGRFGKWLEGARDWNISRNRFWGCPIPVWRCDCGNKIAVSSVKELHQKATVKTDFYVIRHGEAESNVRGILSCDANEEIHLTEDGRKQVQASAQKLKKEEIAAIIASPFPRTRQTAQIISDATGVPVQIEKELSEHDHGNLNGTDVKVFMNQIRDNEEWYDKEYGEGESLRSVEERVAKVINDLILKYPGKKVVIVTHGNCVRVIRRYIERLSIDEMRDFRAKYGEINHIVAGQLPLRGNELDLHKPYIDSILLRCEKCNGNMKRISEVLDCWFESGAMPYAQLHYPFDRKDDFENNFPANFIAEGLDQTRGWFYTLHVISSILFNQPAQKNIIVNGILLAADGEKLSKRKKNYPDPTALFDTHGVDTTRLFLYNSTAPQAEDVRFSEKHVEELVKKFTLTLWNTYSFFISYATIDKWQPDEKLLRALKENKAYSFDSPNKLDQWILSALNVLVKTVTEEMEAYNLTRATRPLVEFIDSLSNWYVRRSRRRFWKSENDGDKVHAYNTLYTVLVTLTKVLAPFMPFISDSIFKNLTNQLSVHLEDWPAVHEKRIDDDLNIEVQSVRTIVSLALSLRARNNLKVRQPLQSVTIALPKHIKQKMIEGYRDVILEEINIKELSFATDTSNWEITISPDARKLGPIYGKEVQEIIKLCKAGDCRVEKNGEVLVPKEGKTRFTLKPDQVTVGYRGLAGADVASQDGIVVSLSTELTDALKQEGVARDLIRAIQELRKQANYNLSDRIRVSISGSSEVMSAVTACEEMIKRETLATELIESGDIEWDKETTVALEEGEAKIGVCKE